MSTGREVVTVEQAAPRLYVTVATLRKDITRRKRKNLITELEPLNGKAPVYYPEELGL